MSETAHPVDALVGARVRLGRQIAGLSQRRLAEAVGTTFQQIQKYESGSNRIGAGRLSDIAAALGMPVAWFFEGATGTMLGEADVEPRVPESGITGDGAGAPATPSARPPGGGREHGDLLRAFNAIPDAQVRRRVIDLVRALAETMVPPDRGPRGGGEGQGP